MASQGVKEEIFEKVPDGELITWYSSLVMQPKSKYTEVKKEETQMIRASMDMGIDTEWRISSTVYMTATAFHKGGSKTRLPPAGTRLHYETGSKFSPSLGKL